MLPESPFLVSNVSSTSGFQCQIAYSFAIAFQPPSTLITTSIHPDANFRRKLRPYRRSLRLNRCSLRLYGRRLRLNYVLIFPVSNATSRASTARRLPDGFVRSDCRKPVRCSSRRRCPWLMWPTVSVSRIPRTSAVSSSSNMVWRHQNCDCLFPSVHYLLVEEIVYHHGRFAMTRAHGVVVADVG